MALCLCLETATTNPVPRTAAPSAQSPRYVCTHGPGAGRSHAFVQCMPHLGTDSITSLHCDCSQALCMLSMCAILGTASMHSTAPDAWVPSAMSSHASHWARSNMHAHACVRTCVCVHVPMQGCQVWVWCSDANGCGDGLQRYRQCWLKNAGLRDGLPLVPREKNNTHPGWISGVRLSYL